MCSFFGPSGLHPSCTSELFGEFTTSRTRAPASHQSDWTAGHEARARTLLEAPSVTREAAGEQTKAPSTRGRQLRLLAVVTGAPTQAE